MHLAEHRGEARCTVMRMDSGCNPKARTVTCYYTRMDIWMFTQSRRPKARFCELVCQSYMDIPTAVTEQGWPEAYREVHW